MSVDDHVIMFLGPPIPISETDLFATVDEVLRSPETQTVSIPERLWCRFTDLIKDAETKLGLILNTWEEEWVEGAENVEYFGRACADAVGVDSRLDPYLVEVSKLAGRQAAADLPLVICT